MAHRQGLTRIHPPERKASHLNVLAGFIRFLDEHRVILCFFVGVRIIQQQVAAVFEAGENRPCFLGQLLRKGSWIFLDDDPETAIWVEHTMSCAASMPKEAG